MFIEHFGFKQNPFSLAYDSSFFNADPVKEKICEQILRDLQDDNSPILLTAETAAGHTQLLQHLYANLPSNVQRITPINGNMNYAARVLMCIDLLMEESQQRQNKLLLIIDNTDEIPEADLKFLLLLPRHQGKNAHSFQMIWCGSSNLQDRLRRIDYKKYKDYPHHYHLDNLDETKIKRYIHFRLDQIGYSSKAQGELFSSAAIKKIAQLSQGNPHTINLLCSASLILASRNRQDVVNEQHVEEVSMLCSTPSTSNNVIVEKQADNQEHTIVLNDVHHLPKKITIRIQINKTPSTEKLSDYTTHRRSSLNQQTTFSKSSSKPPRAASALSIKRKFYMGGIISVGLCTLALLSFPYFEKTTDVPQHTNTLEKQLEKLPITTLGQNSISLEHLTPDVPLIQPKKVEPEHVAALTPVTPHPINHTHVKPLAAHTPDSIDTPPQKIKHNKSLSPIKPLPEEHNIKHIPKENSIASAQIKPTRAPAKQKAEAKIVLAHLDAHKTLQPEPKSFSVKSKLHQLANVDRPLAKVPSKTLTMASHKPSIKIEHKPLKATPEPILDAQEMATRDRAASRLKLYRMGVEFSADSLVSAADKGDLPVVKLLLEGGVPANVKNRNGQTALMSSAKNGHKQVIKELLKPRT